jgi:hypothetical protein
MQLLDVSYLRESGTSGDTYREWSCRFQEDRVGDTC